MKKTDKSNNKKLYALASIALFAVIGATLLIISRAATPTASPGTVGLAATGSATLSVSPDSSSYATNSNFVTGVYVDSGSQAINGVNVKMSYNATQLEIVSIASTGTSFAACPSSSGANGSIALVCYVAPPNTLTGRNLIANITFKVKASSGTSVITFVRESELLSKIALAGTGENIWDGAASGGSYTLGSTTSTPSGGGGTTTPPASGGGSTSTPTSGTSGGSKAAPKSTTSGGSSSAPAASSNPTTTPTTVVDPSAGSASSVASSTPQKINTNAIVMYAAVIGGAIALVSVSGMAFAKVQRRNKFNRAHGMGKNNAVVFDANSTVHNPQTSSIDQGPMVMPSAPAQPTTTPSAAPIQPITQPSSPQQGSIITPDNKPPSA